METVIAISAIFISVVSLFTSIYFSWRSQQHNKKSVIPIPYFNRADFENQIHIRIHNKGTGPLIINEIKARHNESEGCIIDIVPSPPYGYIFSNFSKFTNKEQRTIAPGESNDLIVCEFEESNESHEQYKLILREFLKDMTIECSYTDVYGSNFEIMKIDCKWYGRHSAYYKGLNDKISEVDINIEKFINPELKNKVTLHNNK